MYIKEDYDFNDLMNNCWSGAEETLKVIEENGKEDAFMELLEMIFTEPLEMTFTEPTLTEVNDFLRLNDDYIYDTLGIKAED